MDTNRTPNDRPSDEQGVADRNLERLLRVAYDPEEPGAEFAKDVRQRMQQAAGKRAAGPQKPRRSASVLVLPVRRALGWSAAAALVLMGLGFLISNALRQAPRDVRDRIATSGNLSGVTNRGAAATFDFAGGKGLVARPRAKARPAKPLVTGTWVEMRPGERRRFTLPEGSVVYVNEGTRLKVENERRVRLERGELFVEVAPRKSSAENDGATFIVATPTQEFRAYGTKFAVRVDGDQTNVLVTQGKVRVSGRSDLVYAGRQLSCGRDAADDEVAAIPRASHVLEWTKDLMAAAETPLVPASDYGGGALIVLDPNGQEARLSLRRYHVDVHIEDGFARTTIDQTYFNHMHARLEGTFYFPLPPDASISRLAMYVNGKLMEGGMAERGHARYVFEDIMYTRRDPALLEWVDGTTFKMRVFPLEPRRQKRILISYVQRLDTLYGRTEYRLLGGHNMELVRDWSFRARVKGGGQLEWDSPSHELDSQRKDGDLLLSTSQEMVMPKDDLVLHIDERDPAVKEVGSARFSSAVHEGYRYLMLRYRPDLQVLADAARERRDWVFLFESSGDRDPLLARAQIDVVRGMLAHAQHDDRFTILTAGTHVRVFSESLLPVSPDNVQAAVEYLEKAHLVGALDLQGAIAAARPILEEARAPHLVHVGSGIAVLGERRTDRLVKAIPAATHYIGVGVGKRWSRTFMKEAAARTGGFFTQIDPDENVAWRAFELVSTINTPALMEVAVTGEPLVGKKDDPLHALFLSSADVVAQGEELCAVVRIGKDDPLPISVRVRGTLGGEAWSQELMVQQVADEADYLPRVWAKLAVDRMVGENAEKNKAKIIALSKAMYVMSPFTSLLVLENEAMYKQYNVDRGRKDHWALYPAPGQIEDRYEHDPAHPLWGPRTTQPDKKADKPAVQQVLGTLLVRIPAPLITWPNVQYNHSGSVLTAWQIYSGAYAVPYARHRNMTLGLGEGIKGDSILGFRVDKRGLKTPPGLSLALVRDGGFKYARSSEPLLSRFTKSLESLPRVEELVDNMPVRVVELLHGDPVAVSGKLREILATPTSEAMPVRRVDWQGLSRRRGLRGPMSTFRDIPANRDIFEDRSGLRGGRSAWGQASGFMLSSADNEYNGRLTRGDLSDADGDGKWASDGYAYGLNYRLRTGYRRRNVLYQRPRFSGNWQVFSDLLMYAPGMNTTRADVQAVLAEEAKGCEAPAPGKIDPVAHQLIERARSIGWRSVTIPDSGGKPVLTVTFDGAGRYAYGRTTWSGLTERVLCDGKTLWHLYDELGVGAERKFGRFYRGELEALVPWALPPAEDLAGGANVTHAGGRIVALTAVGSEEAKDADGKPVPFGRVELEFGGDGRLVERRLVKMPTKEILYRQTFAASGAVRWLDAKGKQLAERKLTVLRAPEPNLEPDKTKLVILPMPVRTESHIASVRKLQHNHDYRNLSEPDALALIAANLRQGNSEVVRNIAQRFFSKGDRRIGFYTLLLALNRNYDVNSSPSFPHVGKVRMHPTKDHPRSALARYITEQLAANHHGYRDKFTEIGDPSEGFAQRLAGFRYLYHRWTRGQATNGTQAHRKAERERALRYVRRCGSSPFAWAILTTVRDHGGDQKFYRQIAEAAGTFQDVGALAYAARYETGSALRNSGDWKSAKVLFKKLHADTLEQGVLPPIDSEFYSAMRSGSGDEAQDWAKLMRRTSATLIERKAYRTAVVLAWQCRQVGDAALGEELLTAALVAAGDKARAATTLIAVEMLYQTGEYARADALIKSLLADEKLAEFPSLWRLGALVAERRGRLASALRRHERAMELEYGAMGDVVNLQAVRQEYGAMLTRYHQLAQAIATLDNDPPADFLARVISVADRWRAMDPDDTAACQSAAKVLGALGQREAAWEYLTTPLATRPNEAAPWTALAGTLKQQGEFDLADRAYASAFEAERTNAQILWDRAQLLQQVGRYDDARALYKQIADGKWSRQYNGVQSRAKQYVGQR